MSSYQIFLPHARGCAPQLLRDVGLADLLDPDLGPSAIDVHANGPEGLSGVVFYWHDFDCPERNPAQAGVHLASQIWQPCKPRKAGGRAQGAFWFGRDKEAPVTPADLARNRQLPGLPVKLQDGQEWLIPIAKQLPHKIELDADGEPVRRILGRYAAFYAEAGKYYDLLRGYRSGEPLTIAGAFAFAVEALALNYRINRDVADFLELFTEENILWTIGATFELSELDAIAAQKKKAPRPPPALTSSPPGGPASCPTTSPRSSTSISSPPASSLPPPACP